MREFVSLGAGLIAIISGLPYIIHTATGRTKPNLVSWLTWTLIAAINTVLAWKVGALPTEILAGSSVIVNLTIVTLSFRHGIRKYTAFDMVCQISSIAGIVLWLITKQPTVAAIVMTVVSVLSAIPTWRHAWAAPHHETWETFAVGSLANLMTLLSLSSLSVVATASPLTFLCSDIYLTSVIVFRRKWLDRDELVSNPLLVKLATVYESITDR
jgi:hypothetical protein